MADEDDAKKQEDTEAEGDDKSQKTGKISGLLPWIIMAVIIIVCAGSGFAVGRLFGGSGPDESTEQDQLTQAEQLKADDSKKESQATWYYDELEPVVANLDEPGVTRYVRVSLTLEINSDIDQKKAIAFFESKKPLLKNWLTIYLASLTLENIRGDSNLKRIQSQIRDAFNEKLFPDSKPQIKYVLFKEFAIQ